MVFVKFHERKTARSGPANPHMPGLRRPHTRHTSASAFVSLPQDGQRIDPDVLRNIAALVVGDAVALVEPHAEVDGAAREGTGRSARVPRPGDRGTTCWADHALLARLELSPMRSRHCCRQTRCPSQPESYECPQSVSTRVLGARAGTVGRAHV